jgi:methionyl-tRNA synthetase
MEAIEMRKATAELRGIWVAGNEYLQRAAPWTSFKENPDQAAMVIRTALNLMALYATVSEPFIPDASKAIKSSLNWEGNWPSSAAEALNSLPNGHNFTVPENLFRKIDDGERDVWDAKFSGTSTA